VETARAALAARLRGPRADETRRFRLLAGAAEAADGRFSIEETAQRLGDLLVPALADLAIFDVVHEGELRRLSVAATGDDGGRVEAALGQGRPARSESARSGAEVTAGRPRLIAATEEGQRSVGRDAAEVELLREIGVRAGIDVPLFSRGRALGRLTLFLTTASRRTYVAEELEFVEVLAGRIALALDNAGLFRELQSVEAQLSAALESLTEAVTILNGHGDLIYANAAAARLMGYAHARDLLADRVDSIIGRYECFDEDGLPVDPSVALPGRQLLRGEEASPLVMRIVDRETGEQGWRAMKASAVRDEDGHVKMVVYVTTDISADKEVERTQRVLAAAGEALGEPRDFGETLEHLAALCVPELADWAAVVVPDGHGYLRARAVASGRGADPEAVRWLREEHVAPMSAPYGVAKAFREQTVVVSHDITDEQLAAVATSEAGLQGLRRLGMRSALAIPLSAGETTIGVLSLINTGTLRRFTEADITLALGVARRAAGSVETARLYTERSAIAATLQRSLLPDALPEMPGWSLAALYRPAGEETWVGGDFYEALRLGDDWLLVVGDVTGRGAEAAALTGLMRHTLRTAARLTGSVSAALEALNQELVGRAQQALCTAVCVLLRETDGHRVAEITCAGHPLPALVRRGEARYVGRFGTVLGAFADETWTPETVALEPGDVLVLYSDGVLDTVGEEDRFGPERLEATVRGATGAHDAVERVEAALSAFASGSQADDTAVLAVSWSSG
jgi:GAF domain-containing protein